MNESTNLTFSEIKYLKVEDIALCITKEAALEITKDAQQDEATGAEILGLWADKLLQTFTLTAEEWTRLSQYLKDNLEQNILVTNPTEKHVLYLTCWLDVCMKLVAWLQPLTRLDLECTGIALAFVLQTEVAFLSFYREWHKQNDLKQALQSALMLQSSVVKALNQNIPNLEVTSERQFSKLTEVIAALSEIGEQTQPLDIKTIVETWKCVAKLVNHLAKYLHLEEKLEITERIWVKRPLLFLLHEVARNLSTIYKEDTLKQRVEQVEKYLRVTNFYLKLLLGLASDFKHNQFPAVDELVSTLSLSKRVPTYFRDTEIPQLLEKYVQNGLKDVLSMVYKHVDMQEAILRQQDNTPIALYYLDASVDGHDTDFICNNVAGFVQLFEFYFNDLSNVTRVFEFNDVFMGFAALARLDVTDKFNFYLRENVLSAYGRVAYVSMNLLLVSIGSTADELLREFQFWRQCNDLFALCSTNPKQLPIQHLLRHFFSLCKSCKELTAEQIWDGHSAAEWMPKDYRFLLAVGLEAAGNDALENSVSNTLQELINEGFGSKEKYYKTVIHINLLATAKRKPTEQLLAAIFGLVARVCDIEEESLKHFHQLLNASYTLATRFVKTIPPAGLLFILKSISRGGAACVTVPCIILLKACSQLANLEVRTIAAGMLKGCAAPTNKTSFALLNTKGIAGQLDAELFRRLSKLPPEQPTCSCATETSPASKRIRLETPPRSPESPELKSTLADMLSKSQTVLDLSGNLSPEDLKTLNSIINNLNLALVPK